MNALPVRLLLLEDNPGDAGLLQATLATYAPGEFVLTRVESLADALAHIRNEQFDVVLADLGLPDSAGLATVQALTAHAPELPLVVLTVEQDDDLGRAAIRNGAQDYLVKGEWSGVLIARTLCHSIERARLEFELREANATLERRVADRTLELEKTNDDLRQSEARFRSLSEMSSDFYWETDAGHRHRLSGLVDSKRKSITLYQRGTQIGERSWEVPSLSPDAAGWQAHQADMDAHRPFRNFELSRAGIEGRPRHISVSGDPVFDASGAFKGYHGVGTDITERKTAEAKIQRLSQLYAALSQCNEAIVRSTREEELFPQVCRAAVQFGGMKMAWVGMVDPASPMVRFAASSGDRVQEYLQGVEISVAADSPLGLGPTGAAFREDQPVWCQDFRSDPRTAPWHEKSVRFGWGASASLPLRRHGVPVGLLTLLASEVGAFDEAARKLLMEMATDISFALDNFAREAVREHAEGQVQDYLTQLHSAFMSTVEVATTLSELRDPYTAGHERRVGQIAVAIGAELGLDEHRQEGLRVAGYLHDVGKITIPAEILSKPGQLSPIEFKLIQVHAQASYDVLRTVKFPWPVAEVALQHHERMDGSGYPQGLKGEAITLEARIVAVADVIEAMSSHRPYRAGLGIEAALAEIERGSGSGYDRAVVQACMRLFREKGYAVPA